MHSTSRSWRTGSVWLALALLSSCASVKPVAVVSQCPPLPAPPPELWQPPQSKNATTDLQSAFQQWADDVKKTPPTSNSGKTGTETNKPPQ